MPGANFFDVFEATGSPIAQGALRRIAELYAIEADISGQPAATRLAVRQERTLPVLLAFHPWLEEQRCRLSAKSALGKAIQYAFNRWEALLRYTSTSDGRIGIDDNPTERSLRGIAITRKNFLFLGSEAGGARRHPLYRAGDGQAQWAGSRNLAHRRDRPHGQGPSA